jgi:hypothetical protein
MDQTALELDLPFDSIESALEFVALLEVTTNEVIQEVTKLLDIAERRQDRLQTDALRLALLKTKQLRTHMQTSQRILNDLRSIRILLFKERAAAASGK